MERIDDLQLQNLKIIQDSDLFCFGTDAVLLADFVNLRKDARIADLGTGNGILPLLLYGRKQDITVHAIELQEELYRLAQRSIKMNGLESKICIVHGDIKEARQLLDGMFDTIVSNPPYERAHAGINSLNQSHKIARFETEISFEELCVSAQSLLKSGGRFSLIHRATRFAELCSTLKRCKMEPKEVRFVHSFVNKPSAQVLISAVKDGNEGVNILPPLIVHNEDGSETDEIRKIYHREGGK